MQRCGALKERIKDPGWVCDGSDLIQVLSGGLTTPPTVIRRDLLPQIDKITAEYLRNNPSCDFPGGDHGHLVLPPIGDA